MEDENEIQSIEAQLAETGLRKATANERGWYVTVWKHDDIAGTYAGKVFATDGK